MSVRTPSGRPQAIDGSNADGEASKALPLDDVCHLLQNERRRNALRYLREADDPVRMRDVAEQVAAWEYDTTVERLDHDQRKRVYIALYQCHLPKLDDAGVIEYDRERGRIEPTESVEELFRFLDWFDGRTDDSDVDRPLVSDGEGHTHRSGAGHQWWLYYSSAAVVAGGLVLASAVAGSDALLPDSLLAPLVLVVFAVVIAAHYALGTR